MRDEPDVELRCQTIRSSRSLKRCWFIVTAGRWSWKSKPAKECVTTHLPNGLALKIDGAETLSLNSALWVVHNSARKPKGVDERGGSKEAFGVTRSAASSSADLGGSSKYSSENLEGRSGERFHENSKWSWVNRS